MDSRDRLPLIHEQPSSQKQSHQEREKNQQNQTKKNYESTEPTFRIENREKKSREIDRRSSCTSECLSSLVSSTCLVQGSSRRRHEAPQAAGELAPSHSAYAIICLSKESTTNKCRLGSWKRTEPINNHQIVCFGPDRTLPL